MDVFVLIPRFFTQGMDCDFPMIKPLITMTHVCRSWGNALLSTPGLWTQVNFSTFTESQQGAFLYRSGDQPLEIHHHVDSQDSVEPFLSITLLNLFRLRGLAISSQRPLIFDRLLRNFSAAAPELKYLEISNDPKIKDMGVELPKIFGGQMPKLTSLKLHHYRTNLHNSNFPSLARFSFRTRAKISVRDLTSFFERCPLLESIQICLSYAPQPPTAPHRRTCLATLRELDFDHTACTTGLLDHPKCTVMTLNGEFTGATLDHYGFHAAHIHPSSIDHLPVMRGITKAVAMPSSCVFSGPNGDIRFWCFEARKNFDADFLTSFSPISVSQIRELWVGQRAETDLNTPWKQTTAGVSGAFTVLAKVEDLTVTSCETKPIFTTLGATADRGILLPGLRRLTVYVGYGDLDTLTLIRCAKARREHSQPLGEVIVVWEKEPGGDVMQAVESLKEFVGKLTQRVGEVPKLSWKGDDFGIW